MSCTYPVVDRAKYPVYTYIQDINYWIGTGQVMKRDLFHSRSHRKFTFRPVIYLLYIVPNSVYVHVRTRSVELDINFASELGLSPPGGAPRFPGRPSPCT